jgi:tetratricopeptide (TPR) repeat protein
LGILVVTGLLTGWLSEPAWKAMRADEPALHAHELDQTLGQGLTIGLLGGFRAIVADFLWLQTNTAWEEQDLPTTQNLIRLVSAVDPRPLFFWINGSRMIGYDMPSWRIQAAGGYSVVPQSVQTRFDSEQAAIALDHLRRGLTYHPNQPYLFIEMAGIHQHRLKDLESAAKLLRKAAEQDGAPYYAARIHAELLRRIGKKEEAYQWLKELHPTLNPTDPFAMPDLVLERIRELENELAVPEGQIYDPPGSH